LIYFFRGFFIFLYELYCIGLFGGVMKKRKEKGLYIALTKKEENMIKVLKIKYAVNMSQFMRNAIRNFYKKMEGK